MRPTPGKLIAIGILAVGLLGAVAAQWLRLRDRAAAAADLQDPALRAMAFTRLLRSNGLWSTVRECSLDERGDGPGKVYVRDRSGGLSAKHVVRGVRQEEDGSLRTLAFVFSEGGKVEEAIEDAWPVLLSGGGIDGDAGIVARRAAEAGVCSIFVIRGNFFEAMRVRGSFVIAQPGDDAWRENATTAGGQAVFRFDTDNGGFRGPAGGPDKQWEVDQAHSPRYVP